MKLKSFTLSVIQWSLITLGVILLTLSAIIAFAPKPQLYADISYSTAILSDENTLLRISLADDDQYRLFQPIETIAPALIEATLLYEDQDYYQHWGVDVLALFRAAWSTYGIGHRRVGASTIAMQVARMRWQINSSTFYGKFEQIYKALVLTRYYNKQEILEAYFNGVSYGQNVQGIAAASLIYFNKTADKLTWPEAMMLSVVPQNPSKRAPGLAKSYTSIKQARDRLFELWLEKHPEDVDKKAFLDLPLSVASLNKLPFIAPHFTQYQLQQINNAGLLDNSYQSNVIETTLNVSLQKQLENRIEEYVSKRKKDGINNAAALLINYETNTLKAMVGSADFFSTEFEGQVNGTTAKRSPGSALKPFVYALAMDEGLIHPMTMLRDTPKQFAGFSPENYDKRFLGPVFAKNALITSRNVPAVDLQAQLKHSSFYEFLVNAGIKDLKEPDFYGLALALGGGEVTMLELAQLYAGLARGGEFLPLISVKDQNSKTQKEPAQKEPANTQQSAHLLSAEASYLILDILKDNPPPDGSYRNKNSLLANDIAWKTGTSWAFRDAWAVGVSGPYVLAVWVGNFNGEGNPAFVGRTAAGPLLFSIFSSIFPDQGWKLKDQYNLQQLNIKKVDVCANTGDLPSKYCPNVTESWFIPGVSPIKVSTVHRAVAVDNKTGLRACDFFQENTELRVYEFWPSDFLQLFQQAGISLKSPPAYLPECQLNTKSASGQQPLITSPLSSIDYVIDNHQSSNIQLQATVDSDVTTQFWFIDNQYIGQSSTGNVLSWQAEIGEHEITVVDDSGRSSSKKIRVINQP
ncbi:penicillin-binding protein 1C [Sessilibacter sp. MAH4]